MSNNSEQGQLDITLVHPKCGSLYRVAILEEEISAEEDCPVCREVRAAWQHSGGLINRASAGTPLAAALGLALTTGAPGPTSN